MLEFSLTRLKESVQKTAQKNERLSFENDMLRKGIEDLQGMREALLMKKAELSGRPDAYRLQKKIRFIDAANINSRKKRIQELTAIFLRDIEKLEEKIEMLDDRLSEESFRSYKKRLSEERTKSKKELFKAEKQLNVLKRRNLGPQTQIEELKRFQNGLAYEVQQFQKQLNRL